MEEWIVFLSFLRYRSGTLIYNPKINIDSLENKTFLDTFVYKRS